MSYILIISGRPYEILITKVLDTASSIKNWKENESFNNKENVNLISQGWNVT